MILAFIMLFAGFMLVGGAWSFFRQKKPWWSIAALALVGLLCVGVAIWRIQTS
ncbi:hypothetical protein ACXET9_14375 [Brachybacterium sp. DNPG3]